MCQVDVKQLPIMNEIKSTRRHVIRETTLPSIRNAKISAFMTSQLIGLAMIKTEGCLIEYHFFTFSLVIFHNSYLHVSLS
jgi:hypothetical protein